MQDIHKSLQSNLKDRLPFWLYDIGRLYEGAPRPCYMPNFLETHYDIAWHSEFKTFYPHTYAFRFQKALVNSDLREIEKIVEEYRAKGLKYDLDKPIDQKYGLNPLQMAASTNQHAVIEYLLMLGAKIDVKDKLGNTPLAYAVMNESMEATHTLLKGGADLQTKDKYGYNIIEKAKNRDIGMVPFLQEQQKKKREVKRPSFKLNPKLNNLFSSKWDDFVKRRRRYTGRALVFPFNDMKGHYRIVFSEFTTLGGSQASQPQEKK